MYDAWRRRVLALLKVPPEPQPPFGDPASLRVFRAGRNFYRLRMATWTAAQIIALGVLLFWTAILIEVEMQVDERRAAQAASPAFTAAPEEAGDAIRAPARESPETGGQNRNRVERVADRIKAAAERIASEDPTHRRRGLGGLMESAKQFFVELLLMLPAWALPLIWVAKIISYVAFLVELPITYVVRRLDYEMRWYMVTDRSLRLRHGVWKVTEFTMSFANVQQVMMTRGPLQRLLGLADVKVQSAGGGSRKPHEHKSADDDMHLGMFRHVTQAPEIRDLILERLRRYRDSGLGDRDDTPTVPEIPAMGAAPSGALAAVQEVLAEARALRTALG